jgi:hypothetical protein
VNCFQLYKRYKSFICKKLIYIVFINMKARIRIIFTKKLSKTKIRPQLCNHRVNRGQPSTLVEEIHSVV